MAMMEIGLRVGAVGYLNAKPLYYRLDEHAPGVQLSLDYPSVLADQLPAVRGWQSQVLASFALFQQMHDCARGIVDTRLVVFCVSGTVFFLFLTLRIVESRRWK